MEGFVAAAVKDINSRLQELQQEQQRLMAARAMLTGEAPTGGGHLSNHATRGDGHARSVTSRGGISRRNGHGPHTSRRSRKTRAMQVLELVQGQPGITIPQMAERLHIQPNYLYRVLPRLAESGEVSRTEQGWHPGGAELAPTRVDGALPAVTE
jgi:CRP-like cAMP-binding protein